MVLLKLFAGQEERRRCGKWTCGCKVGKGRVGRIERSADTSTLSCVARTRVGSFCITQGAQLGAL